MYETERSRFTDYLIKQVDSISRISGDTTPGAEFMAKAIKASLIGVGERARIYPDEIADVFLAAARLCAANGLSLKELRDGITQVLAPMVIANGVVDLCAARAKHIGQNPFQDLDWVPPSCDCDLESTI